MLTEEIIKSLSVQQLRNEILARGGHLSVRATALKYLRYYLLTLRYVEPNINYVPKKRRCSDVTKAVAPVQVVQAVAPVQVVQAVAPVQVVQEVVPVQVVQEFDIPTPPSTPTAIRVFGFSPRAVTWNDWPFTQ